MSAICFLAKITEAKLSTSNSALTRIELRRCVADGSETTGTQAEISIDVPTHRLNEFLPGSIVTVSIHPAAKVQA